MVDLFKGAPNWRVCSFTNPGESVGTLELCTLDSNRFSRDLPSWYASSVDACRSRFTQCMTYTFFSTLSKTRTSS
uniref:Pco121713 n=1 Tax=Arundo donax TaxID=35708 RepID=A0A0A8XVY2_ARUDO